MFERKVTRRTLVKALAGFAGAGTSALLLPQSAVAQKALVAFPHIGPSTRRDILLVPQLVLEEPKFLLEESRRKVWALDQTHLESKLVIPETASLTSGAMYRVSGHEKELFAVFFHEGANGFYWSSSYEIPAGSLIVNANMSNGYGGQGGTSLLVQMGHNTLTDVGIIPPGKLDQGGFWEPGKHGEQAVLEYYTNKAKPQYHGPPMMKTSPQSDHLLSHALAFWKENPSPVVMTMGYAPAGGGAIRYPVRIDSKKSASYGE